MSFGKSITRIARSIIGLTTSGLLLSASCTANELRAVVIGIEAAASALGADGARFGRAQQEPDLNFGQWLISEIDD